MPYGSYLLAIVSPLISDVSVIARCLSANSDWLWPGLLAASTEGRVQTAQKYPRHSGKSHSAVIVDVVYGMEIAQKVDRYIDVAEKALEGMAKALWERFWTYSLGVSDAHGRDRS